jgi:hypothetical protein
MVWVAGAEVPSNGVPSKRPSLEDLQANQDEAQPADFDYKSVCRKWELSTTRPID